MKSKLNFHILLSHLLKFMLRMLLSFLDAFQSAPFAVPCRVLRRNWRHCCPADVSQALGSLCSASGTCCYVAGVVMTHREGMALQMGGERFALGPKEARQVSSLVALVPNRISLSIAATFGSWIPPHVVVGFDTAGRKVMERVMVPKA